MKFLQLLFYVALLLAFISALSVKLDETKYVSQVKCDELSGKCLLKIIENSNVEQPKKFRVKRSFMTSGKCAQGQIWYLYRCWDCQEYTELTGNDCPQSN